MFRKLAVIHFDYAIAQAKILIIMGNGQHRLTPLFEFRQNLSVEDLFKDGVLVRGPLIKNIEGPVLQISREQRQPLALTAR